MTTCECQLLSRFIYDDLVQSNLLVVKKQSNGGKNNYEATTAIVAKEDYA